MERSSQEEKIPKQTLMKEKSKKTQRKDRKKRKTELEKLMIDDWKGPVRKKRTNPNSTLSLDRNPHAHTLVGKDIDTKKMMAHFTDIGYEDSVVRDGAAEFIPSDGLDKRFTCEGVADWEGLMFGAENEIDSDTIDSIYLM